MALITGSHHHIVEAGTGAVTIHSGILHVNAIVLARTGAGTDTTILDEGGGADVFIDVVVPANDAVIFTFAKPQIVKNLAVDTQGTNVVVHVYHD